MTCLLSLIVLDIRDIFEKGTTKKSSHLVPTPKDIC